MEADMKKAVDILLAQPETAGLGAELRAEYDRVQPRVYAAGWGILVGLLVVATVGGFFFTMRDDLEYIDEVLRMARFTIIFMALPGLVVLTVAIVSMVSYRRTYLRARMCAFLDARSDLSPEVQVARQAIETRPVAVVFHAVSVAVPILLVVFGLAWAGVIWLGTTTALNTAKNPKGM